MTILQGLSHGKMMRSEPSRFSLSLYRQDALEIAMTAYAAVAQFRTERQGQDVLVYMETEHVEHYQQIHDAFCSHVLFETIVKHRESVGAKL